MSLDIVNDIVIEWANERVNFAKQTLSDKKGKSMDATSLGQSIAPTIIFQSNNNLKIGIEANDYYDFVNKGVKGVGGSPLPMRKSSGVYSFKTKNVGTAMIESIVKWIPFQAGLIITKPKRKVNNPRTSPLVQKFNPLMKGQKGQKTMNPLPEKKRIPWEQKSKVEQNKIAAYGMAMSVKMRGLEQTGFWDDTFNDKEFNILVEKLQEALGQEINLTLTIE